MRGKQRLAGLALALALVLALPLWAAAQGAAVKVHDDGGLFTESERAALEDKAAQYAAQAGLDYGIATTSDAGGKTAMAYADDFYDGNGYGTGDGADGMLLLIDMDNREIYITTHGEAHRLFADQDLNAILDDVYECVADGDYAGGANAFLDEALRGTKLLRQGKIPSEMPRTGQVIFTSVLIALGAAVLVVAIMAGAQAGSLPSAPSGQSYLAGQGINVTRQVDNFIGSNVTRVPIPKSPPPGSSGSSMGGGGSRTTSSHTSSSGSSHGGAGRKF